MHRSPQNPAQRLVSNLRRGTQVAIRVMRARLGLPQVSEKMLLFFNDIFSDALTARFY
jgi:hypothetical protein